jgi:putative hemolysin
MKNGALLAVGGVWQLSGAVTMSPHTAVPALIKGYLRLGGFVGEGAYVDRAFNTTDVCLVLDTEQMSAAQARIYGGGR